MVDSISTTSTSVTRQRIFNGKTLDVEKGADSNAGSSAQEPLLTAEPHRTNELEEIEAGLTRFWDRFSRKGRRNVGVVASLRAIAFSSWLNLFVVFIPLAWIAHFVPVFGHTVTYTLCFLALVPLEWLFDWGGEQLALYLGTQLGDLVVITLNNVVEATVAIILLVKCELRLLQSTIVGVVILHLLLIPGAAFVTGGAMIMHQDLHPHLVQLNHTLLTVGVLSLLLPAAFFSVLDRGVGNPLAPELGIIVTDKTRQVFLTMSYGLAIILLLVYICSRIFLHNPPGEENAIILNSAAPAAMYEEEKLSIIKEPKANQWVLIVVLLVGVAIMAATTEWMVESVEFVRVSGHINEEWFGMFLLPIVSWAANGFVAIVYFLRYLFKHFFKEPGAPEELAKARAIDLSIQFTLFWMPLLILLGWWIGKPMSLLFDFFEVAVIIGSCFVVNYVTADAKTNWIEGFAMVAFYFMIALCAWFYTGQVDVKLLLGDPTIDRKHCATVAQAVVAYAANSTGSHAA